jgi:hypothetical protein
MRFTILYYDKLDPRKVLASIWRAHWLNEGCNFYVRRHLAPFYTSLLNLQTRKYVGFQY